MEEIFEKNKCFEIKTICLKEEREKKPNSERRSHWKKYNNVYETLSRMPISTKAVRTLGTKAMSFIPQKRKNVFHSFNYLVSKIVFRMKF